jgi:hypothetical protein
MPSFSMNRRGCQAENRVSHRYRQPIAPPATFGKNKAAMTHQVTRVTGLTRPSANGKRLSARKKRVDKQEPRGYFRLSARSVLCPFTLTTEKKDT